MCGPYGFIPDAYYAALTDPATLGDPARTMKAVRTARATEMSVGEERTFDLWRTGPPSWLREDIARRWLEDSGFILRLRVDCRRGEWEPWTFLCKIDTESQLSTIEIP